MVTHDATRAMLVALNTTLNPDDVAGIDPQNKQAKPGDTVTLFVARNGFTPSGGGTTPTSAPATTTAPRTTASSAPPTSASVSAPSSVSVPPTTSAPVSTPPTTAAASSAPPTDTSPAAGSAEAGVTP